MYEALGVEKPKILQLLSDGGTENTGKHIRQVLEYYRQHELADVEHKVALKDIDYSNNMIERFFRIMKSVSLFG